MSFFNLEKNSLFKLLCFFFLIYLLFNWKWKWKSLSHVRLFVTPWNSLGQNTGVGSPSLLQESFPVQGSNPGLPHCRWILYQLSHKGSPFNWRIVALQNFVVFCQTSTWINHRLIGIPISPLSWTSLPSSSPPHPSRLIKSPSLCFLRHRANSHWPYISPMVE